MKILTFMDDISSYHRTMDLIATTEEYNNLCEWLTSSYDNDVGIINLIHSYFYDNPLGKRTRKNIFIILFSKEEQMTFFWLNWCTKIEVHRK